MKPSVIDLFCGIGGLSYGFTAEGFKIVAGFDSDTSCQFAFEKNIKAKFYSEDVASVSGYKLKRLFGERAGATRVLIGCAPCTPFSSYSQKYRRKRQTNKQWQLLKEFQRLVLLVKPDVISMENVPRLTKHKIFHAFVRALKGARYHVTYYVVKAEEYGVPQHRARLVLFASKLGPIALPKPTHRHNQITVRKAIGHLPKLRAGEGDKSDRLHTTRGLSAINLKRLKATKEGGGWAQWAPSLRLRCHKKTSGKTFRSVYGRMRWNETAPVVTTQFLGIGNGRFGHPSQDRAISAREAALLQSFPRKFRFIPPRQDFNGVQLSRQIGNAVPPRLGKIIVRAIKRHLTDFG